MEESPLLLETPAATAQPFSMSRRQKWGRVLGQFLSGQISVQALNLLIGFFLLRWLSKTEFAQFSLAFAFQSTLSSLVDLGFSGSVVALVGENKADSERVGKYIDAARTLRAGLTLVGIAVSCLIFPIFSLRQGWSASSTVLLLSAIIATVLLQSQLVYSSALLIYGRLKAFYTSQILAALSRFILTFSLYVLGWLSAGSAACVVALSTAINGTLYRRGASALFAPSRDSRPQRREMLRYLAPMMPLIVFSTLQNQIVMAFAAWFGRSANIAEVAALGRLGQLFLILGAFNSVVVQPYIAALSLENLVPRYFQVLLGAALLALTLGVVGFAFPQPFLWLLGKNYGGLEAEVGLSIAAASLSYLAGVVFTMNSARKWVFWWSTVFEITLLIVMNLLCVRFIDLNTTLGLVTFSVVTGATFLAVHLTNGAYGLIHRKKLHFLTR